MILDVRKISTVADYLVICSGHSEPQLKAIAEATLLRLRTEGVRARHFEGGPPSRWLILDYVDVMFHIFHPELRERYALEQLWGDGKRVR